MQLLDALSPPQVSEISLGIDELRPIFPHADDRSHRASALLESAKIPFAGSATHQLGNGRLLPARLRVQHGPELIVEIELRSSHDV